MVGHRYMFNGSQIFGIDGYQGWHQTGQYYMPIGRGASESSAIIHPVDNIMVQGGYFPLQWKPAHISSRYPPSTLTVRLPPYPAVAHGSSQDPYLHQSPSGNIHMHPTHPSSNIGGQRDAGVDGGLYNQTIDIGRGQLKRKSPCIPLICDQGPTSRQYDAGSSSNVRFPVHTWQGKHNTGPLHAHWEYPPSYRVNSLSMGGEGAMRNVRSRVGVDLETNQARTHLSSTLHHSHSSYSSDLINSLDFWGHGTNTLREWNHNLVPSAAQGVTLYSDPCYFNHDPNSLNMSHNHFNSSFEIGGYSSGVASNTNLGPRNDNSHLRQPVRGLSGYGRRSAPTFRASFSYVRPGHVASSSDRGQQMVEEGDPPRHQHSSSDLQLQNVARNGTNFVSGGRDIFYPEESFTLGGPMSIDDSAFDNGSNDGDMRLDIDSMSYEELLELGERIGSVSTGLSDGSIWKCLNESTYYSSGTVQEEGTCDICLEEYKNMDNVGTLKACKHDFHVGCIHKWLSMKNSCPICKAEAYAKNGKSLEK